MTHRDERQADSRYEDPLEMIAAAQASRTIGSASPAVAPLRMFQAGVPA